MAAAGAAAEAVFAVGPTGVLGHALSVLGTCASRDDLATPPFKRSAHGFGMRYNSW